VTAAAFSDGAAGPLLKSAGDDWRDHAACAGEDPELFFAPSHPEAAKARKRREGHARAICARCPVREPCLADVLEHEALPGTFRCGIFGGTGEDERHILAAPRKRKRAVPRVRSTASRVMPALTAAQVALFRSKLAPGGCGLVWTRQVRKGGYGVFKVRVDGVQQHIVAHRLAYRLATGTDPGNGNVRQSCGIPACCTPGCLVLVQPGRRARAAIQRKAEAA